MSDLVTKVVNEIAICRKSGGIKCEQVCDYCKDDATRAIKAVAEWLQEDPLAEMCCVAGATLLSEMESSE